MAPAYEGPGPHAVRPSDGNKWHMVCNPLDARALCGLLIAYGARLAPWAEITDEDRCGRCVAAEAAG